LNKVPPGKYGIPFITSDIDVHDSSNNRIFLRLRLLLLLQRIELLAKERALLLCWKNK